MAISDTLDSKVKSVLMKEAKEIEDVILLDGVSDELIEFAKTLFTHSKK